MATQIRQPEPLATRPRLEIISRRLTCIGLQYVIADEYFEHVITINGGYIGCSCADGTYTVCPHIDIAQRQENVYLEEAKRREMQHALFDVSNQEMMERIYG